MAGSGFVLLALTAAFCLSHVMAAAPAVPSGLEVTPKAGCLNLKWTACDPANNCQTKIDWTLKKDGASDTTGNQALLVPAVDSTFYTYCLYKANDTCCTTAKGVKAKKLGSFDTYDYISFNVTHCDANNTDDCSSPLVSSDYVMPAKNPCVSSSPCKNSAKCASETVNDYKCTCTKGWTDKNCTTAAPKSMGTSQYTSSFSMVIVAIVAAMLKLM